MAATQRLVERRVARAERTRPRRPPAGDNEHVRDQRRRDEQTLAIATTLAVFVATLAVGIVGIVLIGAMTDIAQTFDAAIYWVVAVAIAVGIAYLVRHNE